MQQQITKKPSKATKRALISAVLLLIYEIFFFLVGVFVRVSGMFGCDDLVAFGGCPLQDLFNGFSTLFAGFLAIILMLVLGLTVPIFWILVNGILIIVGWMQQDSGKKLLIASLILNVLALVLPLYLFVVVARAYFGI